MVLTGFLFRYWSSASGEVTEVDPAAMEGVDEN